MNQMTEVISGDIIFMALYLSDMQERVLSKTISHIVSRLNNSLVTSRHLLLDRQPLYTRETSLPIPTLL